METNRRGFMALLGGMIGGLVGAKAIGPLPSPTPEPDVWRAAPSLPKPPVRNFYVPLEVLCSQTLVILNEELKWLRLKQVCGNPVYYARRIGDTVMVHEPMTFSPRTDWLPSPCDVVGRYRPINVRDIARIDMHADAEDWERPLGQVSKVLIEPAAYGLAEGVIQGIRRNGGGEFLVTADLEIPPGVNRAVVQRSEDLGLSVRAMELLNYETGEKKVFMEMLYGVG